MRYIIHVRGVREGRGKDGEEREMAERM